MKCHAHILRVLQVLSVYQCGRSRLPKMLSITLVDLIGDSYGASDLLTLVYTLPTLSSIILCYHFVLAPFLIM